MTNIKLPSRSFHDHFVGMESDERICKVYSLEECNLEIIRLNDFKSYEIDRLPNFPSFLDGLSRQINENTSSNDGGYS